MTAHHRTLAFTTLAAVSACLMAAATLLANPAPASGLPPRPPSITPTSAAKPMVAPSGAHIELRVSPVRPGLFTVVQWQNDIGQWFTVEGWQGDLDDIGNQTKTWWVAPCDGAKGPFRWVVYDRRGGQTVGVSQPFTLPAGSETLGVYVPLNAH